MKLKFSKGTNKEHKVELESKLIAVQWTQQVAYAGQSAAWVVRTAGVGAGAPVTVEGRSLKGKKLGSKKGMIRSNQCSGSFKLPDDIEPGDEILIEAKLKKNSLDGESLPIPVRPKITVSNLKWDREKVQRGEVVKLTADVTGLTSGETVKVKVYEYDSTGSHDPVHELEGTVRDNRMELYWAFQYFDNTEDIPDDDELEPRGQKYEGPKYFFTVVAGREEFGKVERDSGLMKFDDFLIFKFLDEEGLPLDKHEFVARFSDGTEQKGETDSEGKARLKEVPPGRIEVDFPGAGRFVLQQEDGQ